MASASQLDSTPSVKTFTSSRAPDLELPWYHPKRSFIRRVIDLEIRLAYYDRVLKTLPEAYTALEAKCVPEDAPGPEFEYESQRKCLTCPFSGCLNFFFRASVLRARPVLVEPNTWSVPNQ